MKKFLKIAGLVVLGIFVLMGGLAGSIYYKVNGIKDTHDLQAQTDDLCTAFMQQTHTPGLAVAIVRGDSAYITTMGVINKATGQKTDSLTLFEIGSITKVFTAEMAQLLVEEGQLHWDDNMQKYLPAEARPGTDDHTTLLNLVTHTSGYPRLPDTLLSAVTDWCDPYSHLDKQMLYTYLQNSTDKQKPDLKKYDYSNFGMGLLGHILEFKTGKSYEMLLQELICQPCGLKYTSLHPGDTSNFATGYDDKGQATCHWHFQSLYACGAIRSNITDMLRFLKANMSDSTGFQKVISKTQKEVASIPFGSIAYGWHIDKANGILYGVPEIIWHNGGTGGFRSYMGFNKSKKIGVIVLANQVTNEVDELGIKLLMKAAKVSFESMNNDQ